MAVGRAEVYHNLANLLEAGVPVVRALNTAASGLGGRLQTAFADLAEFVSHGNSLSEAMGRHPKVFQPLDVLLVEAGETAGSLPAVLNGLSDWYSLCRRLKRTVSSGMILPVLTYHVAAIILPFPSMILGRSSTNQYWAAVICILAVMYVPAALILGIVYLTPSTGILRRLVDALVLKIPVVGRAFRRLALNRFLRVFSMLYEAGVPIVQSAEQAAQITGNSVVGDWLRGGAEIAKAGRPISEGFLSAVPPDLVAAWQVGEESGDLDEVTTRLAQMTGESAEQLFGELAVWIPRLIYLVICIWLAVKIVQIWTTILPGGQ